MILCAGNGEVFPFATSIGVGMVESSITLTELVIKNKPKFLFFIGSAGSYGEKEIFEIIHSKSACNIENSYFNSNSYTPIENLITTSENVSRETIVNSSNYITTDFSLGEKYIEKNIHIENMEFFSVMHVAKRFGLPAGGLFAITNYCNENAHKDFKQNQSKAMELLNKYISENRDKLFANSTNGK
ncbi:MAG: purine-nucleoside phosphorylase [Sulfurovaceae bacterium]|nr:purine-nucleoside phosphorylase [Sulfurovaceae bacterium]MDD5548108.1 purine-nucleoside phosphorylase [Sulfurovaceae bacterium]